MILAVFHDFQGRVVTLEYAVTRSDIGLTADEMKNWKERKTSEEMTKAKNVIRKLQHN